MAHRNPGARDLVTSLIESSFIDSLSESDEVIDLGGSVEPTLAMFKPHPACTNFSLDTLSVFMQNELAKKLAEEQKLRTDPLLASVEVEKKELRRLVNSNKPICASVRNGRLEVRELRATPSRSQSTPASEGDNELSSRRPRSVSGPGNSRPYIGRGMKFEDADWPELPSTHKSSSPASRSSQSASTTSRRTGGSAKASSWWGKIFGNSFVRSSGISTADSTPQLQSEVVSQSMQHTSSSSAKNGADILTTSRSSERGGIESIGHGASLNPTCLDHQLVSKGKGPKALQDISNAASIQKSSTTDRNRSLSFEKHADEVRQSTRSFKGKGKEVSYGNESEATSAECENPRPRKVTGFYGSYCLNATAPDSQPLNFNIAENHQDTCDANVHQVPLSGAYGDNSAANFATLTNQDNPGTDDSRVMLCVGSAQRAGSAGTSDHNSGNIWDDVFMADNSIPKNSVSKRKQCTGRDTFYSSSDDPGSGNEEDTDGQLVLSQKGKSKILGHGDNGDQSARTKPPVVTVFDYSTIVAERLPSDIYLARENCRKIWSLVGLDGEGAPDRSKQSSWYSTQYTMEELNPDFQNILGAADQFGYYPRKWKARNVPISPRDPPIVRGKTRVYEFPSESLPTICQYLSSQDVRNLRLVNKATAAAVMPLMVRSTVINFGQPLFGAPGRTFWDNKSDVPASSSIIKNHGSEINKFGIAFDFDSIGLANAEPKAIEEIVDAWFGRYTWPLERYPSFSQLKELEDLVDSNRPLLKNTMKALTNVSELALSIDSGHGWLNGPDISDLALFKKWQEGGSKVFGKAYDVSYKWNAFALRQYFRWGQLNTINALAKRIASRREGSTLTKSDRAFIRRLQVRHYDDYRIQSDQPDFNRTAHTGGVAPPPLPAVAPGGPPALPPPPPPPAPAAGLDAAGGLVLAPPNANGNVNAVAIPVNAAMNAQVNAFLAANGVAGQGNALPGLPPVAWVHQQQPIQQHVAQPVPVHPPAAGLVVGPAPAPAPVPFVGPIIATPPPAGRRRFNRMRPRRRAAGETSHNSPLVPQWPLLFNCYNLAAEMGGNQSFVRDEIAQPANFPYMPGSLNETQVQWLMETLWAQRAFLSAYTNSIIANSGIFKNVHTLSIARLSSGLIPSIAQDEFWSSLPGLKKLTLKVIPDWRQEHIPGDKFFHRNMPISPVDASLKLANLLRNFVAKIESLSSLTTGFVGGGEHQTGIFGRNRHVLPAPITSDPQAWLTNHLNVPEPRTLFVFNHIRDLSFENCWFSPCMLETFMQKSKDTSLHHLTLDSVSLTGVHDIRADGPLTAEGNRLRCDHSPSEWLHEIIPRSACWVNVLEKITPGQTILDRKYNAEMIDEIEQPRPEADFRGNVKKITLKSCGYVRISGVNHDRFAQNGLVEQGIPWTAMDEGLESRKKMFYVSSHLQPLPQPSGWSRRQIQFSRRTSGPDPKESSRVCIMMSNRDPETGVEYFGLGKLTQCVHPVEKRVLERAWNLRFGWGDTNERWAAVEDGWYEGGTGRFSGTIERDSEE